MTTPNLDDLPARMTWAEKLAQLQIIWRRDEDDLRAGERVKVSATVRNVGDRDRDDVVLVYLSDPVASLAQPVQRLRGFRRVAVAAGGRTSVSFDLAAEELGFWDDEEHFVLEPGELVLTLTDGTDVERITLTVAR